MVIPQIMSSLVQAEIWWGPFVQHDALLAHSIDPRRRLEWWLEDGL